MRVFVINKNRQPLMPCHPARARELLRKGKAAVFRRYPFTLILKEQSGGTIQPISLNVDPGSKTTGIALVADYKRGKTCIAAINLKHRGQQIKDALDSRRANRRARRNRNTRHRKPRFLNRTRPNGWLPPSVMSRVHNVKTCAKKLAALVPLTSANVETVRFDLQKQENANISGIEYQQGTLFGYELREYLLQRHSHTCAYCKGLSDDPVLEIEHILPKSKGGTDRVANLVIACQTCNKHKNDRYPADWTKTCGQRKNKLDQARCENMLKILDGYRPTLKDAAAVNATRYAVGGVIKEIVSDVQFYSGGLTKKNRTEQGYAKDHWIDAACVGEHGNRISIEASRCLEVSAKGHGSRQMCRVDRYGFPRSKAKGSSRVKGFKTGDVVHALVAKGKKAGRYTGRVAVRSSGSFNIAANDQTIQGINARYCRIIHRCDGYGYNINSKIAIN